MNILFYSIKGGQGKTTHAVWYAHHIGARLVTNDTQNGTSEIYQPILWPWMIQCLEPWEELRTDPGGRPSVFDFGGWGDHRILTAATLCDLCVVPLYYQSTADMTACLKTIQTLQEYNKNIVILINNTRPSYIPEIRGFFKTNFPIYPVFVVNSSKYINRMADEGKTVPDLFDLGGLHKYALRKLKPQLYNFYDYLDSFIK